LSMATLTMQTGGDGIGFRCVKQKTDFRFKLVNRDPGGDVHLRVRTGPVSNDLLKVGSGFQGRPSEEGEQRIDNLLGLDLPSLAFPPLFRLDESVLEMFLGEDHLIGDPD